MPFIESLALPELPTVVGLVAGLLLLVAGRRLFWLTVGLAGFVTGFAWAGALTERPGWALLVGVGVGLLAGLLAVLLAKIAVGLAGFLVGGWALAQVAVAAGWVTDERAWVVFLVGGLVAGILAGWLFEAALVAVSAALGAGLVAAALDLPRGGLAALALFAAGVVVQLVSLRRRPARPLPPARAVARQAS
jgi:hypothetical protein